MWAYSGGTGTSQDPYLIASAEDLIQLGNTFDGYGLHYALSHDIDLSGYTFTQAVIARAIWPTDYVIDRDAFSGHFDGQGHVIRYMSIQGKGWLGLFGGLAEGAVVANVRLEQASIVSAGDQTGALVGLNLGLVLNCSVQAEVTGQALIGGLVGLNKGTIVNCWSHCDVSGLGGIGGLAGTNEFGRIHCAFSLGSVTGSDHAGGLVGRNWGGTVSNTYSAARMIGQASVGGLVGDNPGPGGTYPEGTVVNSFWDIQASGMAHSDAGIGLPTPDMEALDTFLAAGWDFAGESANGTCETWSMPDANGYPQLHWFEDPSWHVSGAGSSARPYDISSLADLGRIMYAPTAHYRLTQSIDLTGIQWSSPVVPFFAGVLDGNDVEIQNLSLVGGHDMGLIGVLGIGSRVSGLGVTDVNMVNVTGAAGALAAQNRGTVSHCYSTGEVRGITQAGGLLGINEGTVQHCFSKTTVYGIHLAGGLVGDNRNTIKTSFSAGNVFGQGYGAGGLTGMNQGTVTDCFATGPVTGINSVGGLVGTQLLGQVSHCYSMGHVVGAQATGGLIGSSSGTVDSSFWEVDTSIQVRSAGGTGKTTSQMTEMSTFIQAGWDFTGNPSKGVAPVWYISDLQPRPALVATGQFAVHAQSNPGGRVIGPGEGLFHYLYDTILPIQAVAEPHYHFLNWTGLAADQGWVNATDAAHTWMQILGNSDLYANFAVDQHLVTIGHAAHGQIVEPNGLSGMVDYGARIKVSARADPKYLFLKWLTEGDVQVDNVTDPETSMHVLGDGSVYAVFILQTKAHIPDPAIRAAIEAALGTQDVTMTEMEALTKLEVTDANVFDLTGLQHAVNLTYLDLRGNDIIDVNTLGSLTALTVLSLGQNRVADCSPLASLARLQAVNLEYNMINSIQVIAQWKDIEVLRLDGNAITEISPLLGLEHLTWLEMKKNPLSQVTRQEWSSLKQTVETKNYGIILHDPISFIQ
ncbi:MAG: hypothetical protein K9N55_18960 [Phycisphaerae bacterium]|nr:hypothetical protein [Phycisphaerae bacterium]